MPLTFHANVPHWMRRMARRWCRVLGYLDWKVRFQRDTPEDLLECAGYREDDNRDVLGLATVTPEYLSAELQFSEALTEADAEEIVIHEILHLHYEPFKLLWWQMWDGRRKIGKAQGQKMLSDLVEASIERHIRQLQRARGKS